MSYKLDRINRIILYELDKNCRISDNQLAKKVNRSREAVRNRIKKLVDDGIIKAFTTIVNPSKCGYMIFKLYFQLANVPKEREKFYQYILNVPGAYFCGGNDGVWDFHGAFYAKDVREFNALKNKIFTDFKHLIIKRDVGVLEVAWHYHKKYLLENLTERTEPAEYAGKVIDFTLDDLDKKILNLLSKDARISLLHLSEKTKSSVDVVRRRMKLLQERRIIINFRISVDYTKLGYEMFKAFVYFNNLSEKDENKLLEYANQHTQVMYLIKQLSAWDVELEIMAKNYEEFTHIMNDIRLKFADAIRNYEFALMREDIWFFGEKDLF